MFLSQVAAAAVVAGIRLVFVSNQSLSLPSPQPAAATAPSLIMWGGTIAANNIYRVFLKMGSKYLEKWARGKRGGRFNLLKISGFSMLNISRIDFDTFIGAFYF